jgi:lipase chaperone LimK
MIKRAPLDLPPEVARAFVKDMQAFFAEENRYKQDEIALRQLYALKQHLGPQDKALRLSDVKEMFLQMRDHA